MIKLDILVVHEAYGSQKKAEVLVDNGEMEKMHLDQNVMRYDGIKM